jgi:hypothetical protein
MYVYIKSEPQLWTVGFYTPDGKWISESDYECRDDAAERVHWLNGGGMGQAGYNAYNDGYKNGTVDALEKLIDKFEKDLTKASWYSKGKVLKLVRELKEDYKNIKI